MKYRQKKIRNAFEDLLNSISGRERRGDISDVIRRIITTSDFYAISPPTEADINRFVSAIWSVICDDCMYDAIQIDGTIPGIHGPVSRFEFVRQYASNFLYETARLENATHEEGLEVFEQKAVAAVLVFLKGRDSRECFDLAFTYKQFSEFAQEWKPVDPFDRVVHLFIRVLCEVEDR